MQKGSYLLVGGLALYCTGLTSVTLWLNADQLEMVMTEGGPVETLSWCLWLVLAGACLTQVPQCGTRRALVFAAAAAACAARELDGHKAFTQSSVFKVNYYTEVSAPLAEKLIAGAVAILLTGLVLAVLRDGMRAVKAGGLRYQYIRTAVLAAIVLVGSKVLDRFPAHYHRFADEKLSPGIDSLLWSHEEGLEMILPVLFLLALEQWRRSRTWTPAGSRHLEG